MQNQIQNDLKAADNIGRQFLQAFFTPGTDISNFYGNDSILSFESETFIGKDDIIGKLKNLQVSTIPTNYSVQPSNNGILIYFVVGISKLSESKIRCHLLDAYSWLMLAALTISKMIFIK